ncbi:MAG: DUF4838 domain-containing protein, partial [Planctomycetes bacterium]|nr:DUF4838 domain-containing protein [Planctomycetota bacterium]
RTVTRQVTYADDDFRRRNRLGGFPFTAGHALESYVTKQQLEENPSWNAEIGGKRELQRCDVGFRMCWANADAAAAVGDRIIAILDQQYAPCVSISPGDGTNFCECAECQKLDAGDFDPSMSCISITDRYIHFTNQIASRVSEKYPEVRLGFLAYVQYTRPPVREKLHTSLIPQLAPITYCRAHTLDDPKCESRQRIRGLLEGWGRACKNIAMYEYYFHLAEVAAPFPAIKRNLVELPFQYANNVTMWTPETMPNFESFTPGLYLGIRSAWHSKETPREILDDFYRNFYGAAAESMADYWQTIDDCWTTIPEHAGCGFSYIRRFAPAAMESARTKMDSALRSCKSPTETRRVQLADDSFRQHELFMKMRRNYFDGRFDELEPDSQRWIATHQALAEKYKDNHTFTKVVWAPETISVLYFNSFYNNSYKSATRILKNSSFVSAPTLVWSHAVDRKKEGEGQGWYVVDFDDRSWKKTDVS